MAYHASALNGKVKRRCESGEPVKLSMPPRKRPATTTTNAADYRHDETRLNNPPAGIADMNPVTPGRKRYEYDPRLDPQLQWAGKAEHLTFDVETVPLHIHERVAPAAIIESIRTGPVQASLFADPEFDLNQAVEFYQHPQPWANRLVLGDSLLVMNSLLERELMAGKVQCIYFDPPYGIKYGSNFQPFTNKRDVKDGADGDLTREPEQIRAFRDTWELGIHSYLTYIRDRLLLMREMLTETGSVFVQISDENVHRVRAVMDEVFGGENFVSLIPFRKKTMPLGTSFVEQMCDFVIWYAKAKEVTKFKKLFIEQESTPDSDWSWYELPDGSRHKMTSEQITNPALLPSNIRIYRLKSLEPSGVNASGQYTFTFEGKTYNPPRGGWGTPIENMKSLLTARRLQPKGELLNYVLFFDDYPVTTLTSPWTSTVGPQDKRYVVQTSNEVIQRCILMTTDPGDLVFDATCVRKGTLVLTPLSPPARGGRPDADSPHLRREPGGESPDSDSPPRAGGLGGVVPRAGGLGGVVPRAGVARIPIESLRPGDHVYTHTGQARRVLRLISRTYCGRMVGLRHAESSATLWLTDDHLVLCQKRLLHYGQDRAWSAVPPAHFGRARELRRDLTVAERRLWGALRGLQIGTKFRRQHPIGPYIADFYARDANLVVEVDGDTHADTEAQTYDQNRSDYLESLGLRVLRFTNREVINQTEAVLHSIQTATSDMQPTDAPDQQWRRAGTLRIGDLVYVGVTLQPAAITSIEYTATEEEVYDLEVEADHSFLTEVAAIHNCGSGTTAYVAEQWGRRWITCDTSRVALALARQRLMTSTFPYYKLAMPESGVRGAFIYKTVPHITLKSIAQNEPAETETLYDQPEIDRSAVRVAGPFTVEAVQPPLLDPDRVDTAAPASAHAASSYLDQMIEALRRGGLTVRGQHMAITRISPLIGGTLHAEADYEQAGKTVHAAVVFGPQYGPLTSVQLQDALNEARGTYDTVIAAAFVFDDQAHGLMQKATLRPPVLGVAINADLLMGNLLKTSKASQVFSVFGKPDVTLERVTPLNPPASGGRPESPDIDSPRLRGAGGVSYTVTVKGVDIYDPNTGEFDASTAEQIAAWFLDTDYDGATFLVRQAYFPAQTPNPWEKISKAIKGSIDPDQFAALQRTTSLPFKAGKHKQCAVKVIDMRGNEVMTVMRVV